MVHCRNGVYSTKSRAEDAMKIVDNELEIASGLIDLARIENKVPPMVSPQKICFDAWNMWDPARALGKLGAEKYTLSDA